MRLREPVLVCLLAAGIMLWHDDYERSFFASQKVQSTLSDDGHRFAKVCRPVDEQSVRRELQALADNYRERWEERGYLCDVRWTFKGIGNPLLDGIEIAVVVKPRFR